MLPRVFPPRPGEPLPEAAEVLFADIRLAGRTNDFDLTRSSTLSRGAIRGA